MNISDVINDIKLSHGLNTIALPYDKPVEQVIAEILKISIRTFSRFKPYVREYDEWIKNLRYASEFDKRRGIFILPEQITVSEVFDAYAYPTAPPPGDGEVNTNPFTVGSPFVGFGSYYPQDIVNASMIGAGVNKYAAITSNPPSTEWMGFNKIRLINFPDNVWVHFVVNCSHDLTGETIPESCVESFMELASLDVERTLYSQLKNMTGTGGAFKESQIKIDEWSGAEQARKELINQWTNTFHYDDIDLIQFF